jgi:signal transduction histidine kinase/CheY-like chemotaxis protein
VTRSRQVWLPYVVLGTTLFLTAVSAYYAVFTSKVKNQLRFESAVQRSQNEIEKRLETYIAILRTGRGLFASNGSVDRQTFKAYVDQLELRKRYPGIQGVGFSKRIPARDVPALVQKQKQQGFKTFAIRPAKPRDEYHSIIYLEPLDQRNQAAIGYDMYSEIIRRTAMVAARDKGIPVVSGKVQLVQEIDSHKQAGFLMYMPIYRGGKTPDTLEGRRTALQGFIYSPFRSGDLFKGIFGNEDLGVDVQIYDGYQLTPNALLHQSASLIDRSSMETVQRIRVGQRTWSIVFTARPSLEVSSGHNWMYITGVGAVLGGLLFLLTRSRLKYQAAIATSETRFRTLVEQSPLSTQILSPTGETLQVNQAWKNLWKTDPTVLKNYRILEDPQLMEKGIMPQIQQAFAGETVIIPAISYDPNQTIPGVTDSSVAERWIQAHMYPVKDDTGAIREVVIMHEDITDRKAAAEALQHQAEELMQANRMKDEFLSILSHELRTPLNAMQGWTAMLRLRRLDEAQQARALETIDRNTKLLTQIIEDLLDVSRIISGKLPLKITPVHLVATINAAIETVHSAAEAKEIQLQRSFEATVPTILADANRLQQIVWNLLSNAIKFTPKRGQVQICLSQADSMLLLQVSDTGKGIPAEFLPHVFERFRQADSSTTRNYGGLGLGLAIVRHLTELHGGTVSVESEGEDQGATFTVKLPIRAVNAQTSDDQAPPPNASHSLQGVQVLVVDDDEDACHLVALVLKQEGAMVVTVDRAESAIAILRDLKPDVLVSDIGMPGQDGYQMIEEIRSFRAEEGGKIPAIALSAFARAEDRDRALLAGFHQHLAKPVDPETLVAAVVSLSHTMSK